MARNKSHLRLDVEDSVPSEGTLNLGSSSASTGRRAAPDASAPAPLESTAPVTEEPSGPAPEVSPPDPDAPTPLDATAEPDAAVTGTEPDTVAPEEPVSTAPDGPTPPARAPRQTLAGRVWVGLIVAVIALVLLIIFIAENTKSVSVNFLGAHGHISLGLALLIAIVVGIAVTLAVGSARIVQLSLEVRRNRRKLNQLS